ncbi:MAG TPA: 2TM domain-containing protein [Polyangiaceae bacterium]|nr:2TM domain-containing protein [Polyangiaceae bacterium]
MSKDQNYSDEEVRAIIERALKEQPSSDVSHDELLSIGAGVGLSRAALENAARDVTDARLRKAAEQRILSRARRGVAAHAFVYLAVNAILFLINFLTTPGQWWVLFAALPWGLGLILHAGFGLFSPVSERRLNREKRRLLEAANLGVNRLVERRAGIRIAGAADQIEAASDEQADAESEHPQSKRSTQGP